MNIVNENVFLEKVIIFLEEIGINVIEKKLDNATFLPGISLGPNCIYIDLKKILYAGDILHEAGHLAVITSSERENINTSDYNPIQSDEIAAMLWSYAALFHLHLPIEFVFHPDGYKGNSEWLISNYINGNYIGLPFLEWIGLTFGKINAEKQNKDTFPMMQKWLRD